MPHVVIIDVDGNARSAQLATLEEFQRAVGGFIEAIPFGPGATAFVNEDGKQQRLPLNRLATAYCQALRTLPRDDYIVGPVVVMGVPDDNGNDTDIPGPLAAELLA